MHVRPVLAWLLLALWMSGCARPPIQPTAANTAPALQGAAEYPNAIPGWVDTKLYFGLGPAGQPDKGVSEAEWLAFLDREVTPRFPGGLSVLDVYGQWQGKKQSETERLRSKCVIIEYPDTAENRVKVEAIRTAWKKATGDESVLRVTEPAEVSF